jgi:hypothetical protein
MTSGAKRVAILDRERGRGTPGSKEVRDVYREETYGAGWVTFAGIMLMIAGVMRLIDGIWALRYDGAVPENLQNASLGHSLTTYGWTWIIVAAILFAAGIGVFSRSQLARWIGIVAAAIGALTAVFWLPYYPVWSIVYIGLSFAVIYALGVYGGRDVPLQ